ncbi:hypothetical protein KAR91_18970 [Candidatus Pacearchaeota archaeon]|nr:hypothetical protein [Candidatus Pacearchaeota archaeon]
MRVDLLTHDLKIAIIENDTISLIYAINGRVIPRKTNYVAGVGSITVKAGLGISGHRKKIEDIVDYIDPRDYFLAHYPTPLDDTVNRLVLSVVKVAVSKLPRVKVIHC